MDSSSNANAVLENYFRINYNKLVKKVSGRAETKENAEDIVMDAFTLALKYWSKDVKDLQSWFGVILSNALKRHMQAENNYGMCEEFDEMLHEPLNMSQVSQHLIEKIEEEIQNKSGITKEILTLYFLKGYSPSEVIELVDAKVQTVKNYTQLFMTEMRQKHGEVIA